MNWRKMFALKMTTAARISNASCLYVCLAGCCGWLLCARANLRVSVDVCLSPKTGIHVC